MEPHRDFFPLPPADMNTPNRLTVLRIALAPVFLIVLLWGDSFPWRFFAADVIFVAASLTDLFDGKLARKNNQITNFGKFLDPLADKMLITAALLGFMTVGLCDAWVPMIILTREFIVTSVRLIASGSGKVIAANGWGKAKTATQMTAIITILVLRQAYELNLLITESILMPVTTGLLVLSAVITAVSGFQYIWIYREYIQTNQ